MRDPLLSQCVLFNARSLRNKLSELQAIMSVKRISLAFVTESWLDSSISDSLIDPSADYSIYRHDRAMRVGGGVLALVSKQLHSYQIAIPKQFQLVEVECFEVVVDHSVYRFIVLLFYIDHRSLMQLEETTQSVCLNVFLIFVILTIVYLLLEI